jgi:hypothetical protein
MALIMPGANTLLRVTPRPTFVCSGREHGEQRDVLHFYDMGYNVGIIDWSTPLEVGHTYRVQMHGQVDYYRVSQDFVYTPSVPTNVADGAVLVSQLAISSITNPY